MKSSQQVWTHRFACARGRETDVKLVLFDYGQRAAVQECDHADDRRITSWILAWSTALVLRHRQDGTGQYRKARAENRRNTGNQRPQAEDSAAPCGCRTCFRQYCAAYAESMGLVVTGNAEEAQHFPDQRRVHCRQRGAEIFHAQRRQDRRHVSQLTKSDIMRWARKLMLIDLVWPCWPMAATNVRNAKVASASSAP